MPNLLSQEGTPNEFWLEVLKKTYPDHSVINLLGNNSNLATDEVTVWDEQTNYVPPIVAAASTIESSDDTDDKTGGAGAITARVTGCLSDYTEATEVATLDGTTPVSLVNEYIAINDIDILTAGANGVNTGKISVKIGAVVASIVRPGDNTQDGAIYTVPKGFGIVGLAPAFAVSKGTEADTFVKFRIGEDSLFFRRKLLSVFENSINTNLRAVNGLPEKSIVQLQGKRLAGATPSMSGIIQLLKFKA